MRGIGPIRWPLALSETALCSIGSAGLALMGGASATSEHIGTHYSSGRPYLSARENFKRGVPLDQSDGHMSSLEPLCWPSDRLRHYSDDGIGLYALLAIERCDG
jgi:hypothetical protein